MRLSVALLVGLLVGYAASGQPASPRISVTTDTNGVLQAPVKFFQANQAAIQGMIDTALASQNTNAIWPVPGNNTTTSTNGHTVTVNADVSHLEVANASNVVFTATVSALNSLGIYTTNQINYSSNHLNAANLTTGVAPYSIFPSPLSVSANLIEQINGSAPQRFNLYGTYTDGSNYRRGSMYFSGSDLHIGSDLAGTGTSSGNFYLEASGNHRLILKVNGNEYWTIPGDFLASTDNANDIGSSGANRPRSIYAGTSVVSPLFRGNGSGLTNLVTPPSSGSTNVVLEKNDGTLTSVDLTAVIGGGGGSGDVTGPASSTDGTIALFNGSSGKSIKASAFSPASFDVSGSATAATNGISSAAYWPSNHFATTNLATASTVGLVKVDNSTITVGSDGTLSSAVGGGNVNGSGSSTAGHFALMANTSSTLITNAVVGPADFDTAGSATSATNSMGLSGSQLMAFVNTNNVVFNNNGAANNLTASGTFSGTGTSLTVDAGNLIQGTIPVQRLPSAALTNGGQANVAGLIVTNSVTNLTLTASTLLKSDANKKISSIANGAGVLTNDSAGGIGYDNGFVHTNQILALGALKTNQYAYVNGDSGVTNIASTVDGKWWTNANPAMATNGASAPDLSAAVKTGNNFKLVPLIDGSTLTSNKYVATDANTNFISVNAPTGGGASPMVCSNILVQQTNDIVWDVSKVQHLTLQLNTNLHGLTISNAPAITNSPSGIVQLDTWEDTNGTWRILSTNVSGGLLRTFGGWTRGTNASQYDVLNVKLDGTLTNVVGKWDTNAQPVVSFTNTLTAGGGGGGGGGTWTLVSSTSKQGTSGDTTTDPIDISTANLVVVDIVWSGGSPSTISDSSGNTFQLATNTTTGGGNPKIESRYCISPTTSASYTVTATLAGVSPSIQVFAWKKTGGTPVFDLVSDANRTDLSGVASVNWSATPTKTGALSAPSANYLMMSAAAWDGSSTTPANDSSFTMPNSPQFNGGGIQAGYKIETGSATENVGWTGANSVDATSNLKMFH